ncbi:hypothetical protein L7F22_024533 [Adiantum nelumboides]|nr:hypothetical protein [Adiantum nelumboides]
MGDAGLVTLSGVRCVRQARSKEASMGHGEKVVFEVGDSESDAGCDFRNGVHAEEVSEEGCASGSFSIEGDCLHSSSSVEDYLRRSPTRQGSSEAECSFSNALGQLPCQLGSGENAHVKGPDDVCEAGNGSNRIIVCIESTDLASPRLSFSRDFAMVDISIGAPNGTLSNSTQNNFPRLSSEKRKWEHQDDYSSDFEFSRNKLGVEGINPTDGGCMLSAGELFRNGKLLPLQYPSSPILYDDLYLPSSSSEHFCDQHPVIVPLCKIDKSRPYSRHLSFELARPDVASCTAPSLQASVQSPRAPSHTASLPHSPSSPLAKSSLSFKDMFKVKSNLTADMLPESELARDSSFSSICRFPISPKSFWPFLRIGVACEKRTDTMSFACRSILDRIASSSSKSSDSSDDASKSRSRCLPAQGHVDSVNKKDTGFSISSTEVEVLHAESLNTSPPHAANKLAFSTANLHEDARKSTLQPIPFKSRDFESYSNVCKNRGRVTKSFARGSPGRRGGNANKILLKNLERCSAERRLGRDGWRGLNNSSLYPTVAFRVSPVLNVGVYKNGLFGFAHLFSFRKNKKPLEAAVNWRKGA